MRLRKIIIKNFRNLRNITIIPAQKTVIIGENNTGKSNLILALRLILDTNSKKLESELSQEDINDIALAEGETDFFITVEIGNLQQHMELETIFMEYLSRDGVETFVTVEGRYSLDPDGNYFWRVQVLPPVGSANEPGLFNYRMAKSIPVYFLDAVRYAEKELRSSSRGTFSELLKDVDLGDVSDDVIRNIREANAALNQNADIGDLANGISHLLSPQMPGGTSTVSIRVANDDPSKLLKDIRLGLKRQSDSKEYDISRHGTGLQNLVLIAMFRQKIANSGINQPILAIEEPEAHLHPHAQRCLFKDLDKIASPILISTHSPEIVECCDPLGLVKLSINSQNIISAHQLNSQRFTRDDLKLLERMMRSGRADAFFAKSLIIVEGASETIALPAFADFLNKNLDREGVSVVGADSNAFSFILNSCNKTNFDIPAIVTFDSDACTNNQLVNDAFKSGLIDVNKRDSFTHETAANRQILLESLGWIPVVESFEEEIANSGYLPLMLSVIQKESMTASLDQYLRDKALSKNAAGVSKFIKSKIGKSLKIPIATAVANEVHTIGRVPQCFERAINNAITIASGISQIP